MVFIVVLNITYFKLRSEYRKKKVKCLEYKAKLKKNILLIFLCSFYSSPHIL